MNIKLIIILCSISISLILIGCTANPSDKDSNVQGSKNIIRKDFDQEVKNNNLTHKSELNIINSDRNSVEGHNEKLLIIDDLTNAFYNAELHLKPQEDDGFLTELILNDVKPVNYELLDDGIYFYIFKSQQDVERGLNEIVNLPYSYFQTNTEIYNVKNTLIFYKISRGNELERELYKLKIKQIVKDLDK
jgi:hypothetical protein